jgi:glycosyltransferase involved in cell wall biosynthesis
MVSPHVSIIIPTYNRASYLPGALESVLEQTFRDYEVLVVDDGSSDKTAEMVAGYAARDTRIRYVGNDPPHGPGAARNTGARLARGEWIAFLDSDDRWRNAKLACFAAAARQGAVLVASNYEMLDGSNQPLTMRGFIADTMLRWWETLPLARAAINLEWLKTDPAAMTDPDLVIGMTIGGFLWPHTSSAMVSRSAFETVGGFDPSLQRTEDMDLWLKLMRCGDIVYLDQVLASYDITGREGGEGKRYGSQDSSRRPTHYSERRYHLQFLKKLPRQARLSPAQWRFWGERVADLERDCALAAGREKPVAALRHFLLALSRSGGHRRNLRKAPRAYLSRP